MPVCCIIVNWNSKEYLNGCLESIQKYGGGIVRQCIVFDAGSFDGTEEFIEREFPWVEFIQHPENCGFAAANNLAATRAREDVLLFLNPDTIVRDGCIQALMEVLCALPDAGIVAPRVLNADGSIQKSCVQSDTTPLNMAIGSEWLSKRFPSWRLWGNFEAFNSKEPIPVAAVSGACVMMKRQVFEALKGFRTEYFMYAEDVDLCLRVRRTGYRVYHVPGAEIVHFGGSSSGKQSSNWSVVMQRVALETYMRLNKGWFAAIAYRVLQGLAAITRIGLLAGAVVVGPPETRRRAEAAIGKWFAVLRWAVGDGERVLSQRGRIDDAPQNRAAIGGRSIW
jgi:GT2 family glycosyltransferase